MIFMTSPLIKWPGGKRKLLKHILNLLPISFGAYYEPFLGGGALFFALQPRTSCLSDNNNDLINYYIQVRDNVKEVISQLNNFKNTKEDYYKIRSEIPQNNITRAARLIYLTTLSFNGIYRTNLKGEFNVPYGHKTHLLPCETLKLRIASSALSLTQLCCQDFEESVTNARKGDLIYFDPPYTVAHDNNGFLKYNEIIFSWNDQIRLANIANKLARRGCKVIVSNADHISIRPLYDNFKLKIVERPSVIAASNKFRRQIRECLFYNEG
jgi:DNA adenine methylase